MNQKLLINKIKRYYQAPHPAQDYADPDRSILDTNKFQLL